VVHPSRAPNGPRSCRPSAPVHPQWRVTVDANAMQASGRKSVWLQPFVSIQSIGTASAEQQPPVISGWEATWTPYAYWWGYGVEIGG
jgi:hypothetical protein